MNPKAMIVNISSCLKATIALLQRFVRYSQIPLSFYTMVEPSQCRGLRVQRQSLKLDWEVRQQVALSLTSFLERLIHLASWLKPFLCEYRTLLPTSTTQVRPTKCIMAKGCLSVIATTTKKKSNLFSPLDMVSHIPHSSTPACT